MCCATNHLALAGIVLFCFAVSKTSDPLGSYWYYPVRADDDAHPWLPDYPKGAVWPDGLYFSANMHCEQSTGCPRGSGFFQGVRAWAFNRQQMEAGKSLQSVIVDVGTTNYFSMLPSNLRGSAPPSGTPNYFVSEDLRFFAFDVFQFHAVYGGSGSTFTGPTRVSQTSYTTPNGEIVPQPDTTTKLDTLYDRLMMQNQYRNLGAESLWLAHTVQAASNPGNTGIQWAQLNVTGGAAATTHVQQQQYFPDGGSYRVSNLEGEQATFAFTGRSVTWISLIGPDQGQAEVQIDGVSAGISDMYSPSVQYNVQQTFEGLEGGKHALVVRVLGAKRGSSSDYNVAVDGFVVKGTTEQDDSISVTYDDWGGEASPHASQRTYRLNGVAGSVAGLQYSGTSTDWVTAEGPSYGEASVYIDGDLVGTFDLYARKQTWQVHQSFTLSSGGTHTFEVRPLGTKNENSKGTSVVVDGFSASNGLAGSPVVVNPTEAEPTSWWDLLLLRLHQVGL